MEKEIQKKWNRERGALAGRDLASVPLAEAGPARASPPSLRPRPRPRVDGRAATPWRAGRVWPPRGAHAPGWTHPGRPPGVLDRARLRPRCQMRPSTRSLTLSFARAHQQPAPPLAIAACARSSFLRQLWPPPSNLRRPATPPRPSAPSARAQSRSVSLARPLELTGVSRSSSDISARVVLPLLSTFAYVFERVNFALTSSTVSRR